MIIVIIKRKYSALNQGEDLVYYELELKISQEHFP